MQRKNSGNEERTVSECKKGFVSSEYFALIGLIRDGESKKKVCQRRKVLTHGIW